MVNVHERAMPWHVIYIGYPYKKYPEFQGKEWEIFKKSCFSTRKPPKQHKLKRKSLLDDC